MAQNAHRTYKQVRIGYDKKLVMQLSLSHHFDTKNMSARNITKAHLDNILIPRPPCLITTVYILFCLWWSDRSSVGLINMRLTGVVCHDSYNLKMLLFPHQKSRGWNKILTYCQFNDIVNWLILILLKHHYSPWPVRLVGTILGE